MEEAGVRPWHDARGTAEGSLSRSRCCRLPAVAPDLGCWTRCASTATATSNSTAASTRCRSPWSDSASGCAPPTARWQSTRTIARSPSIPAVASPAALHRTRSPAAAGASLLRPRPRLVCRAGDAHRPRLRRADRAPAVRSHRRAAARRPSGVAHGRPYGTSRLEAACARALAHDSPFYRTVKTILAGGFDQQPLPAVDPAPAYARGGRFVRDAESLFGVDPSSSLH